jgi:hypothetical protein
MLSISRLNRHLSLAKRTNLFLTEPVLDAFVVKLVATGLQLGDSLALLHTADADRALILLRILEHIRW